MLKNSLLILLLILFSSITTAQQSTGNSIGDNNRFYDKIVQENIEWLNETYFSKIDPSFELINGRDYLPYYKYSIVKPILFIDKKHTSSITIMGRKFDNINLDYDTYLDQVIYIDSIRFFIYCPLRVSLNRNNIDCFELSFDKDTMTFAYLSKEKDCVFNLEDGFYEVVFNKDSKYIIKHRSVIQQRSGYNDYLYSPIAYINTGTGFLKVKNRKQLIKLFGGMSDDIKTFMKESGINVRRPDKAEIKMVLDYFDRIKDVSN